MRTTGGKSLLMGLVLIFLLNDHPLSAQTQAVNRETFRLHAKRIDVPVTVDTIAVMKNAVTRTNLGFTIWTP